MDYNYLFERISSTSQSYIVKKFMHFYEEGRTFEYSIDSIRASLSKFNQNNKIDRYRDLTEKSIKVFNAREDYYSRGDILTKIIEAEILIEFNTIKNTNESQNKEFLNYYTFRKFVYDLILHDILSRFEKRLSNNSELYRLFYELNNYQNFTLEKFEKEVSESNIYKVLHLKLFPNSNTKKEDEIVKRLQSTNSEANKKMFLIHQQIANFDDRDNAFLIHLCLKSKSKIPLTEKTKILLIAKNMSDYSIFIENANSNTLYTKINKGIDYFKSPESKITFINSLITKLDSFNLTSTIEELKSIRISIK